MSRYLLSILAAITCATSLGAQAPRYARLEGDVIDSVHSKTFPGATVIITRTVPAQPPFTALAIANERGHYRVDTLPAGTYSVAFSSAFLDSLDVVPPERQTTVTLGTTTILDLAGPSGATLRMGACPGLMLERGHGAVIGTVTNADTDRPLAGASVIVSWRDLTIDRKTKRAELQERAGALPTNALGQYRLCDVPTDTHLLVQVQHAGRVGSAVELAVPDDAGVVLNNITFSPSSSRTIASADSTVLDTLARKLRGTATLTGVVRTASGAPLSDSHVTVADAVPTARTDSLGRFTLSGLPAGTQQLEVRHIGYLLGRSVVQLRSGATIAQNVTLSRVVTLDTIKVSEQRSRFENELKRMRQSGAVANMYEADKIEQMRITQTSDLAVREGFVVKGQGLSTKVYYSRGQISMANAECEANVVIDGQERQEINLIPPEEIGAIQFYRGSAGAPPQYNAVCGLIVIWTKR